MMTFDWLWFDYDPCLEHGLFCPSTKEERLGSNMARPSPTFPLPINPARIQLFLLNDQKTKNLMEVSAQFRFYRCWK